MLLHTLIDWMRTEEAEGESREVNHIVFMLLVCLLFDITLFFVCLIVDFCVLLVVSLLVCY